MSTDVSAGARWPTCPLPDGADAEALLWTSASVLGMPHANAAEVRAALRRRLEREPLAGGAGDEGLDLWRRLDAAPPDARDAVWTDPTAYAWTRRAHDLLSASPAAGDAAARDAIAKHLGRLKAFALGVACRSGAPQRFVAPLRAALPLAIPATRWSMEGEGTVEVEGLDGDALRVRGAGGPARVPLRAGASAAGVTVRECPSASHAGYELPLHPHAFHLPFRVSGLEAAGPALRAGLAFQERHVSLVSRTLASVARHAPEVFEGCRRAIHLAALKPRREGGSDDVSLPELPGSFLASVVDDALEMGDHFVHEFQHNRLSMVEEGGPLFRGDADRPAYYSPWRDRPRGLYGIFHGVYVFVAVARYWTSVHREGGVPARRRAYAVDRLLRLPRQLGLAVGVLRRHADLTPLGRSLLDRLAHDVEDVRVCVARAGLPSDAPALRIGEDGVPAPETRPADGRPLSVRESLLEHLRRNDAGGESVLEEVEAGACPAG